MVLPVRHLPVIQNWDCHGCTNCCQEYQIIITEEERLRIQAQGWGKDSALAGTSLFARAGSWWSRQFRLNQRSDGACIFLNEQGRCRIHERFGSEAKPLPCRIYPFMFIPTGKQWRVGLRFSCPSAAANKGRPAAEHRLDSYVREFEQLAGVQADTVSPPSLRTGQNVDWPDLLRFTQALVTILENRRIPIERRLRQCLSLSRICRQARLKKYRASACRSFSNCFRAASIKKYRKCPCLRLHRGSAGYYFAKQLPLTRGRIMDHSAVCKRRIARA